MRPGARSEQMFAKENYVVGISEVVHYAVRDAMSGRVVCMSRRAHRRSSWARSWSSSTQFSVVTANLRCLRERMCCGMSV